MPRVQVSWRLDQGQKSEQEDLLLVRCGERVWLETGPALRSHGELIFDAREPILALVVDGATSFDPKARDERGRSSGRIVAEAIAAQLARRADILDLSGALTAAYESCKPLFERLFGQDLEKYGSAAFAAIAWEPGAASYRFVQSFDALLCGIDSDRALLRHLPKDPTGEERHLLSLWREARHPSRDERADADAAAALRAADRGYRKRQNHLTYSQGITHINTWSAGEAAVPPGGWLLASDGFYPGPQGPDARHIEEAWSALNQAWKKGLDGLEAFVSEPKQMAPRFGEVHDNRSALALEFIGS